MNKQTKTFLVWAVVLGAVALGVLAYMKKQKAKKAADAAAASAAAAKQPLSTSTATPGIVAKTAIMADPGVTTAKDITG